MTTLPPSHVNVMKVLIPHSANIESQIWYVQLNKDLGLMFHVNIIRMMRPGAQSMVWFLFSCYFSALRPKSDLKLCISPYLRILT